MSVRVTIEFEDDGTGHQFLSEFKDLPAHCEDKVELRFGSENSGYVRLHSYMVDLTPSAIHVVE